ncbi:MAG: hypothetical protein ACOYKE_04285 [Ferruginibacter sp.]
MKKLTQFLVAALMLFTTSAFANEEEQVAENVKAAFKKDFAAAQSVSWKKESDFYFASFTINQSVIDVAYNEAGEIVGTLRTVNFASIPLAVSISVKDKYEGYTLPETVMEITNEGFTYYYFTIANDKQVLKLKSSASGLLSLEDKIKKQ